MALLPTDMSKYSGIIITVVTAPVTPQPVQISDSQGGTQRFVALLDNFAVLTNSTSGNYASTLGKSYSLMEGNCWVQIPDDGTYSIKGF